MNTKGLFLSLSLVLLTASCVSTGGTRIDNIPMYGQPEIERPGFLRDADKDFINQAVSGVGSREKASQLWWKEGERYLAEGNTDYAMRRYNQSWLLNPDNYRPYWGFARVPLAKREYENSFAHFDRALALIDDNYEKPALLSDAAIAFHNKANSISDSRYEEKKSYFNRANDYFEKSTRLDPSYDKAWVKWAFSLYSQKNYSEAWEKVHKAQKLNSGIVPDDFLAVLRSKMQEPGE